MEKRKKNMNTTPPSTPQGPESNDMLVSPEYRKGPYPGDRPDAATGEGSTVATNAAGIPAPHRDAEKKGLKPGEGGPVLEKKGQTKGKEEGRDQNQP